MGTVLMRRGALFADICDTTECINNALKEGYHVCSDSEKLVRAEELEHIRRKKRGRPPGGDGDPAPGKEDPLGGKPQE
jgi:hypothetical protein